MSGPGRSQSHKGDPSPWVTESMVGAGGEVRGQGQKAGVDKRQGEESEVRFLWHQRGSVSRWEG